MNKKSFANVQQFQLSPNIGFAMGVALFIIVYGIRILNPLYVDWLLGLGDLSQHYLGWEFFRHDEWRFPIGMTNRVAYPLETSVIFTDSIPVLAVLFKIFNKVLPSRFQYFGIWGLLCFGLQGYFSVKIFNVLKIKKYSALIGSIILILSPIMIYRMYMHTSLAAHWLLLASLYLFLNHDTGYKNYLNASLQWGILGMLAVGIHLYFFPMCFLFGAGYCVLSIYKEKKIWLGSICPLISYIMAGILNTWFLGGFSSSARADSWGLGETNFNLNSFFNPRGFSVILPNLEGTPAQHEGFAYLGLGLIAIILISIIAEGLRFIKYRKMDIQISILLGISIISVLFAVANAYVWGSRELFTIPIPRKIAELWAIFRSTGRFIWIVWYIIAVFGIKTVSSFKLKSNKCLMGGIVLGLFAIIQLYDLSNVIVNRHKSYGTEVVYEYTEPEFWDSLLNFREFKHLCISYRVGIIGDYMELAAVATKYDLTLNAFYFARDIDGMWDSSEVIEREEAAPDTVYIFLPEQEALLKDCEHKLKYYTVGKYVIGVSWLDDEGNVNDFGYE